MSVAKRLFGRMSDGTPVTCWKIQADNGMQAEILDYGVTVRTLIVPDKSGKPVDVVLGYDTLEDYLTQPGYVGATVGRFANRIGGGKFELNGREYQLATNDSGNHLHGGIKGFNQYVWDSEEVEGGVRFWRLSPDGEEGYPGNLKVQVTVSLKDNGLEFHYHAESDKDTIVNLMNHSYFNLNGTGDVNEQELLIRSEAFTVNDENCLPTGEVRSVERTAMDFRDFKPIGLGADSDELLVKRCSGYDVNYILKGVNPAVIAYSKESGIEMSLVTDQPGVQLYTANNMTPRIGKYGVPYGHRSAFCLETQHYPDCIHYKEWPSCVLKAGEVFDSITSYLFIAK